MIVVTGAAGIVGRAVCSKLLDCNQKILPIVRQVTNDTSSSYISFDLARNSELVDAIQDEVSGVIHLAAAVPHSVYYPDTEETANLTRLMDKHLFNAVKTWGCPVIYMSTCGLYDRSTPVVKLEEDKKNIKIESPYFAAKHEGELLFMEWAQAIVMRLSAPIGLGQKSSVVVSRFIELARQNKTLQIWGSGLREQNFVDARDVARLVVSAILKPKPSLINVAHSTPTTMIKLAQSVIEVIGSGKIELSTQQDPRDGETARYSLTRVREIYGWEPQIPLVESLRNIADVSLRE